MFVNTKAITLSPLLTPLRCCSTCPFLSCSTLKKGIPSLRILFHIQIWISIINQIGSEDWEDNLILKNICWGENNTGNVVASLMTSLEPKAKLILPCIFTLRLQYDCSATCFFSLMLESLKERRPAHKSNRRRQGNRNQVYPYDCELRPNIVSY